MKKIRYAVLLLVSFLSCCGPSPQPRLAYFNFPSVYQKINDASLLPFEQIKTPDFVNELRQETLEPDIEQWRLLAGHDNYWRQFSPTQAYYYDWFDFRKTRKQRVYPW